MNVLGMLAGLFGGGQPQPQPAAPTPAQPQPDPNADQATQGQQGGMLSGLGHLLFGHGQATPQDPMAPYRPGLLSTAAETMFVGNPWLARDVLTNRNVGRANQAFTQAYAQKLRAEDPGEAQAFMMDPKGFLEGRYGASVLKPGEVKYIGNRAVAGAPADVAAEHSLVNPVSGGTVFKAPMSTQKLAPNETAYDPNTGKGFTAPAAPMVVAPSDSVFANGSFNQAPAKPEVVKTGPAESLDVVTPGAPGAPSAASGGDQGQPRGLRNNNPWNVSTLSGGQKWAGQTGSDGQFAQFGSVKDGAQAADRNLLARYTLHGLNTIQGVIADPKFGWDPGNTQYAAQVAQAIGVKPTDQIDLANPTIRANVLHAMLPIESGRGAPSAVQGGSVQHVRTGAQARQLSPQEAMERGFNPGVVVQTPDGNFEQKAKLSDPESARIKNMRDAADALEQMSDLDRQFLDLNKTNKTGPQYAMGHANPIAWMAERVNPAISTMEGLASKETLANRPAGVGRILQAEIPMFRSSALDPENTYEVNQSKASEHAQSLKYIRDKADFYTNWAYQHGNLAGADEAWSKSRPSSQPSAPPAKRQASRPANAPPLSLPQAGFRFVQ